jgi:hypothetical protein
MKPNFFIVGAPKSGTTALYEYLRVHPEIFMPPAVKEPHFFDREFQMLRMTQYDSLEAYLALFAAASQEKCVGEGSVYYLYSERAASNIWNFNPDAKIIAILRNPIDMMYSHFYQQRYAGNEVLRTFERALAAEGDRKRGIGVSPRLVEKKLFYREIGCYSVQLERYFACFGREQVQVIIFDDFVKNTELVYRETLEFLNVDPGFQAEFVVHNANKIPRFHSINRFRFYPPGWFKPVRVGLRRLLSNSVRARIGTVIHNLNTEVAGRLPMNPVTRRQLQEEFRSEIERLSNLLQRDLLHWCE